MEFIDYFNIGMGLFLIVMGWLCYRFPNLINPYGGLSPERKALVDIDGLKKASFIILAVTGVLLIVTALLSTFKVISEIMSVNIMTVLVLVMIVPIIIAMKKYNGFGRDKTGKIPYGSERASSAASKAALVITGLSVAFVIILVAFSNRSSNIEVGEETVSISGMYGRDIPTAEIVSVELLEKLPPVRMRTNGSSTGKSLKGHFLLANGEKCMIFVRRESPYIELRTTDNLYYLNGADKEETESLYEQLKALKP